MILRILKFGLLLATSCAVAWFAVISYWRTTNYVPNVADIIAWLGGLPLGMIASAYLLGPAISFARRSLEKEEQPSSPSDAQGNDAAPISRRLVLLESALSLPLGETPADVTEALIAGKRPELDPELRNDEGIPVFAARVEAADEAGTGSDEARARLLARQVLTELLATTAPETEAEASKMANAKVIVLLSEDWSETGRNELRTELTRVVTDAGWLLEGNAVGIEVARNPADGLRLLSRLVQIGEASDAKEREAEEYFVIVTCESRISSRSVRRWARAGELLSASHQNGRVLAEGACALFVAVRDESVPRGLGEVAMSHIALAERGRQEKSKGDPNAVAKFLAQVLEASATPADAVGSSVCDADHRKSQSVEHAVAAQVTFPHLETEDDCVNIGVGCGDMGLVSPLAAVAIGMSLAADKKAPSVILSVSDPQVRAALVISPPYVETRDA